MKRTLLVLTIFLLVLVNLNASKYMRSAITYYNLGAEKYDKAMEQLQLEFEKNPDNAEALMLAGNISYNTAKYSDAYNYYAQAIAVFNNMKKLKSKEEEQKKECEKYIESSWVRMLVKGQNFLNNDKLDSALVMLNKVYELRSSDVRAAKLLAVTYYKKEDIENAKKYFELTAKLDAKDTMSRAQLATLSISEYNKFEEAEKNAATDEEKTSLKEKQNAALTAACSYYTQLTEIEPTNVDSWNNLGLVYQMQGNMEEAIKTYGKVLEMEPNNAEILEKLAYYYSNQKNYPKATEYLEKALAVNPGNTEHLSLLTYTYFNLKNYAKTVEWGRKWYQADNTSKEAVGIVREAASLAKDSATAKEFDIILKKMK